MTEERSIDTVDGKLFVDEKTGNHILFTFEDDETLVVDICSGNHPEDCEVIGHYEIKLCKE